MARVKAVLRRFQPAKPEAYASVDIKCVEYPGLIVNLSNYSVTYDGQQIDMPPKELELLYFLASCSKSGVYKGAASGQHMGL